MFCGRDARAVEHHLAELLGDAVDHAQAGAARSRAGRIGTAKAESPLCFGTSGSVRASRKTPVGDVGVAGPDLVPVDHVLVAVALRGGAQRRQVGPGVGLAEALAPALAAADQAGQEALLDRLAAVRRDPLHEVSEARAGRRAGGGELLVEDDVEDRRAGRDRRSGRARRARRSRRRRARCATPPAGPSTRRRSKRRADPGCCRRSRRAGATGTPLPPASHESPRVTPRRVRSSWRAAQPSSAEPLGGEQRAAQVDVDHAVPGVSHPAVHLHRGLADGARGARAVGLGHASRVRGPRRARAGRRPTRGTARR